MVHPDSPPWCASLTVQKLPRGYTHMITQSPHIIPDRHTPLRHQPLTPPLFRRFGKSSILAQNPCGFISRPSISLPCGFYDGDICHSHVPPPPQNTQSPFWTSPADHKHVDRGVHISLNPRTFHYLRSDAWKAARAWTLVPCHYSQTLAPAAKYTLTADTLLLAD